MPDAPLFDVILLGFRNDLARLRTLDLLRRQMTEGQPLRALDLGALPQRVYARIDEARAGVIRSELERLGAQVSVRPSTSVDRAPPPPEDSRRARSSSTAFLTMLTLALIVAGYWMREEAARPTLPRPAPQQHVPAAAGPPKDPSLPASGALPLPAAIVTTIRSEPMSQGRIENAEAQALNNQAVRLAQAGRFKEAVEALEAAMRDAPDEPVVVHNLQTVFLNWGIADLAADRPRDAQEHLEEAARLGERFEILQALGVVLMRQGNFRDATPLLERALELAPTDQTVLLALADAYLNADRRPDALDLLQRAREAGLRSPELDRRVQQLSREVDAEWDFVQHQDPHFRVSFADDEETSAVDPILDALDDAYYAVGQRFGHYPNGRTPVVLYTQQDFHAITRTPDWAGGAFDGRIKIPVRGLDADDPNLARVVRHEYAHSVIAQLAGPRCPVWLNEGLAVWAEEVDEGERVTWAQERIAGRQLFALDQLNASFVSLPGDRVDVAYAQSYLAIRKLVDDYGAHRVGDLLKALNRYGNLNDAFVDVYRENFSKFQQRLLRDLAG